MFLTVHFLLTLFIFQIVSSKDQLRFFGNSKFRPLIPFNPDLLRDENTIEGDSQNPEQNKEEKVQLAVSAEQQEQLNTNDELHGDVDSQKKNKKQTLNANNEHREHVMKKISKYIPRVVQSVQEKTAVKWPMGIVPYYIDTEVYDNVTIYRISKTMATIESSSCVIFKELERKPEDSTDSWLHITNPNLERECVHETTPTADNGIMVVLAIECLRPEDMLHTLLHGIGFNDGVSNPFRDHFIRILWENIQPKYRPLFRIRYDDFNNKLTEYDPLSIMQFHSRAFSANGGATIEAVIPGLSIGPTGESLSQLDIMKLKLAFTNECNKRKIGGLLDSCKNALFTSKKNKKQYSDEKDNSGNSQDANDTANNNPGDTQDHTAEKDNSENAQDANDAAAANNNPGDTQEHTAEKDNSGNAQDANDAANNNPGDTQDHTAEKDNSGNAQDANDAADKNTGDTQDHNAEDDNPVDAQENNGSGDAKEVGAGDVANSAVDTQELNVNDKDSGTAKDVDDVKDNTAETVDQKAPLNKNDDVRHPSMFGKPYGVHAVN